MPKRLSVQAHRLHGNKPDGYLDLTVQIYNDDGEWISECVELGINSCGTTVEEAAHAAVEAIGVYLQTVEEVGLLERTLTEAGLVLRHGQPPATRPISVPTERRAYVLSHEVRIPVEA